MAKSGKAPKNWRASKEFKSLRDELQRSMGGKDKLDAVTAARIDEYMDFWVIRHQLQDDITARGLYVQDERGRTMENRSVSLSIQASRQMSAIAAALGLVIGAERKLEDDEL